MLMYCKLFMHSLVQLTFKIEFVWGKMEVVYLKFG